MRKTLVQVALLLIVVLVGYVALFKRDEFMAWLGKAKQQVKGYKAAKTPDEAIDYFKKAMEKRDYESAADYLAGDYGVQFRKVAGKASDLAKNLDDFKSAMEQQNIKSDKVTLLLLAKEPFPRKYQEFQVTKKDADNAVAKMQSESGITSKAVTRFVLALKRENDQWKLVLPLTPVDRAKFDHIERYGPDYVNALKVVKNRMKTDATTKENVASDLLEEFKKATKE